MVVTSAQIPHAFWTHVLHTYFYKKKYDHLQAKIDKAYSLIYLNVVFQMSETVVMN